MQYDLELLKDRVREKLQSAPACHDWEHTVRVLRNAKIIASREMTRCSINMKVLEAAAVLHDVARPEELEAEGKLCHAVIGADMAVVFLEKCGYSDKSLISDISECVRRHRFRGVEAAPETIEQKIIYDADKLDSIGAIGVGRAIHFSGRIGSVLHNTEEEAMASESYGAGDSAYREYLVKLRYIPEKLLTGTGRAMAAERAEYMHAFFERLNSEIYGDA